MSASVMELNLNNLIRRSNPSHSPGNVLALYDSYAKEFFEILEQGLLFAVFQPILDMQKKNYLGFEALIRGPQNSRLHSPAELFATADRLGQRITLEKACRKVAIRDFSRLTLPGKLFINLSAGILNDPHLSNTNMHSLLQEAHMRPDDIVIEITENEQVADFSVFRETLARYRTHGYQFAIDDLGEGFSNLRMWSEIRPEYVKIDRHFISGIADDPLKFKLVRAISEIAESCHSTLIAEGIETEAEFTTIRDLGINCGQGYFIARPNRSPTSKPSESIVALLTKTSISVFPQDMNNDAITTVGPLLKHIPPTFPSIDNDTVLEQFELDKNLHAIPVIENGRPIGMINRHTLNESFSRPYRRELYGKRSCTMFMDAKPVIVEHNTPVHAVSNLFGQAARHQIYDGFIITEQGQYLGVGDTRELMVMMTEMQIKAARYANPLTQLPGNVPINEHMDRLIDSKVPFVACYADICQFKPYNDIYGYRRGDEIIKLLGKLMRNNTNERLDFIGHIGGDDFMLLMQSTDWQERCQKIIEEFDLNMRNLVDETELAQGGLTGEDRRGNTTFHPFPTLAIGCQPVIAGSFTSHIELSTAVSESKREAKKLQGSKLFIERRRTISK